MRKKKQQEEPMPAVDGHVTSLNGAPPPDIVTTGLRQLFASVAEEPIPDDFLRLLDEIDASAAGSPKEGMA